MGLRARLDEAIGRYNLLTHPFYLAWNEGTLPRETLQRYARQYYHHVLAFPTYVSAVHSRGGEDFAARQALLENLIEEERGPRNHAALWLQFAQGVGALAVPEPSPETSPEASNDRLPEAGTRALIETFRGLTQRRFAEGAAALYAYESQVPRVAETKIDGLIKHFGVTDGATLEFFEVHQQLDRYHSDTTAEIVERNATTEKDAEAAVAAAGAGAKALWGFLDTMV